jgi:hypothetical protein
MTSAARVAELKRIHAEGKAAAVGAANPYYGQIVNAAVWRGGYRRMLDAKIANSEASRGGSRGTRDLCHAMANMGASQRATGCRTPMPRRHSACSRARSAASMTGSAAVSSRLP